MTPDERELLQDVAKELIATRTALTEHQRLTTALFGMVFGLLKQVEGGPNPIDVMEEVGDYLPDTTMGASAEWLALLRGIAQKIGAVPRG